MDSSECESVASDGSGSDRETRRSGRTGGTRVRGPKFDCSKASFQEWFWESETAWRAKGLHKTYTGENRADLESKDEGKRAKYLKLNEELFRVILGQLGRKGASEKKMRL